MPPMYNWDLLGLYYTLFDGWLQDVSSIVGGVMRVEMGIAGERGGNVPSLF